MDRYLAGDGMRIDKKNGRHILTLDDGQSITLTDPEVILLAQLTNRLKGQLERPLENIQPLAMSRISNVIVGLDAHHTEVNIRLVEKDFQTIKLPLN